MTGSLYGASPEEWEAFIALAGDDVRPIVSDPNIPPSPHSVIKDPLKVPTVLNKQGCYAGLVGWQAMHPTPSDLTEWSTMREYGISLVGRKFHAIDIDVDDEDEAQEIAESIYSFFGSKLPTRRRPNQARRLMLFKISDNDTLIKKIQLTTANGMVEFLFQKQQFVVAGTHKTGVKHYWEDGLPTDAPNIEMSQLRRLLRFLQEEFCAAEGFKDFEPETNVQVARRDLAQVNTQDPEYQTVLDSEYFREILPDGKVAMYCPWQHLHTSTNGEPDDNPSAVVYFPAGLGGREESGFKCQHSSHGEKTIQQLREVLGYVPPEFEKVQVELVDEPPPPPQLIGSQKSSIPATTTNIINCLTAAEWLGVSLRFDEFAGTTQINWDRTGWQLFEDADYPALTLRLVTRVGFRDVAKDKLREAVRLVTRLSRQDSAIEWLESLRWDGKERVQYTACRLLGAEDTPYTTAVSCYIWTALAGRIMRPGAKADMVPVLIGAQGTRKSTFVHALSPRDKPWHTDLSLDINDADMCRLVRGKVIVEVPEMRGMGAREEGHIKAWLTKVEDSWVPKYQENQITVKRRFLLMGTHNHLRFLTDTTGNRRWLPLRVCQTRPAIDVEGLTSELTQYWAEARVMFEKSGIMAKRAEHEAKNELRKYTRQDAWHPIIAQFTQDHLNTLGTPLSTPSIAIGALNMTPQSLNALAQSRVEGVMRTLGYEQDPDDALWRPKGLA